MKNTLIRLHFSIIFLCAIVQSFATVKDSLLITQLGTNSLNIVYSNPDSARALINQALRLSIQSEHPGLLGLTYNYLGIYHDVVGDNDSAFIGYHQAVGYANKQQSKITLAASYNNIGLLHWNLNQLSDASEYFFKAAEIYEGNGMKRDSPTPIVILRSFLKTRIGQTMHWIMLGDH
ncbi:MAG: tetratricopeptide (TPR) repeat protein [Bacteroidia bacterium]|jgi:tetratricopeptide (TPR) repeat protein